jgi:hypothetical protein
MSNEIDTSYSLRESPYWNKFANKELKELDVKLEMLSDLFFKENPFFTDEEYGNRTIVQNIVDDWIIQHVDIVTLTLSTGKTLTGFDFSCFLHGRLNLQRLKIRYDKSVRDVDVNKSEVKRILLSDSARRMKFKKLFSKKCQS